jgi:hypothetical protein
MSGVVLGVLVVILGWLVLLAGPAMANPSEDDDPGGGGGGCPSGGCVNVYTPEDSGSSGSSHSSSGGCGGSSGHTQKQKPESKPQHDDPEPQVVVVPKDKPRDKPQDKPQDKPRYIPPVRSGPVAPAAPVDPGTNFVPDAPAPALPAPVLDQNAVSRGAGQVAPAADVGPADGAGSDDGSTPWGLVPSVVAAAAGVGLALTPGRRPTPGGYAGPVGGFAQAALGGAMSAGPAVSKPPFDLKQHLWDWGGHYLGVAIPAVPFILGAPVTGGMVAAGIAVAVASELKRRFWPSKPQRVDDMLGGNPYQQAQQAGNAGIGQTIRDAHGNAEVTQETGSGTTTWAESTHQVHQDTGGQTQSFGDARRDAIQ